MGAAIAVAGVSALCTALGHLVDKICDMQKQDHHLEKPAILSNVMHSEISQAIPARRASCPAIMTQLNIKPLADSKRVSTIKTASQVPFKTDQSKARARSNSVPANFPIMRLAASRILLLSNDDANESKYEQSVAGKVRLAPQN